MTDLRETVFEALNNSKANGYHPEEGSAYSVACDLREYHSELEECDLLELTPLVEEWRRRRT